MTIEEINATARPGAFDDHDVKEMCLELEKLLPGQVYLETGVDKGRSLSIARLVTHPEVKIYGVDIADDPKVEGTTFIKGDSKEVAKTFNETINLLFIDGDHSYQGCKGDFDGFFPKMSQHGVIFFHDFNETNPGVIRTAAEFVTEHPYHEFRIFTRADGLNTMAKVVF